MTADQLSLAASPLVVRLADLGAVVVVVVVEMEVVSEKVEQGTRMMTVVVLVVVVDSVATWSAPSSVSLGAVETLTK